MNSRPVWPDCPQIRNFLLKLSFSELVSFLRHFNGRLPVSMVEKLLERHDYDNKELWRTLIVCRENIFTDSEGGLEGLLINRLKNINCPEVIDVILRHYRPGPAMTASLLQSLTETVLKEIKRSPSLEYIVLSRQLILFLLQHYLSFIREPDMEWVVSMFSKMVGADQSMSKFEFYMKKLTETFADYSCPHPFLSRLFWKHWLEFIAARNEDNFAGAYYPIEQLADLMREHGIAGCPIPEVASVVSSTTLARMAKSVFACRSYSSQLRVLLLGNHIVLYTNETLQRKWWELLTQLPQEFQRRQSYYAEQRPRGGRLTLYASLVRNIHLVQYEFLVSRVLRFICPSDGAPPPGREVFSDMVFRWPVLFPDPPATDPSLPSVWATIWHLAQSHLPPFSQEWKIRNWWPPHRKDNSPLSPRSISADASPLSPDDPFVRALVLDFRSKVLRLPQASWLVMRRFSHFYQRSIPDDQKSHMKGKGFSFSVPSSTPSPDTPASSALAPNSNSPPFGPLYVKNHLSDAKRSAARHSRSDFLEVALETNFNLSNAGESRQWLAFLLTRAMIRFPIRIRYLVMYDFLFLIARRCLDAAKDGKSRDPFHMPVSVPFDIWLEDWISSANDGSSNDGSSNDGSSNDGASNDGASESEIFPPMKTIYKEVLAVVSANMNLQLTSSPLDETGFRKNGR